MKHQLMVLSALFLCLALGACSPAGEGPVPLTQEEIDQVNAAFSSTVEEENVVWSTPVSGFFTSHYADVRELDFVEFLRYFPGDGTLEDTDQEEFAALAALPDVTKIIIAQRVGSVMGADQIVVLEDGRVHAVGTHQELLAGDPIYQEIYASQKKGGDGDGQTA